MIDVFIDRKKNRKHAVGERFKRSQKIRINPSQIKIPSTPSAPHHEKEKIMGGREGKQKITTRNNPRPTTGKTHLRVVGRAVFFTFKKSREKQRGRKRVLLYIMQIIRHLKKAAKEAEKIIYLRRNGAGGEKSIKTEKKIDILAQAFFGSVL
jgi:hypothetical protein